MRVYGEFDFSNNHTIAQIAPGGIFVQDLYTLKDRNPLLSQQLQGYVWHHAGHDATIYIGRRNVEGGGRQADYHPRGLSLRARRQGRPVRDTWNYNFWWQSATNRLSQSQNNYFSRAKINKALDVVTDPATGRPACASFLDGTDPACVPYDVFHKGGITPAALAYLTTPSFSGRDHVAERGRTPGRFRPRRSRTAGARRGPRTARPSPSASSGASKSSSSPPMRCRRAAILSGSGGASPAVDNQYTVVEFYAEGRLPIMERQDWAYLLNVNGSYRYSNYNQPDNNDEYLRSGRRMGAGEGVQGARHLPAGHPGAEHHRAVHAGGAQSVQHVHRSVRQVRGTAHADGLAGPVPADRVSIRRDTGPRASSSRPANTSSRQGGNPNLKPETANTWTLGLVAQPLPNLSGTVDYWSIKLEDAIGVVPQPLILQNCLLSGLFCDQIHRDAAGTLWRERVSSAASPPTRARWTRTAST